MRFDRVVGKVAALVEELLAVSGEGGVLGNPKGEMRSWRALGLLGQAGIDGNVITGKSKAILIMPSQSARRK